MKQNLINDVIQGMLPHLNNAQIERLQAVLPSATKADLLKIEIAVPPMELQNQFATFVEQTDKSKLAVQQSLEKLEILKNSLMQKYFG